jgi:hypothetical protein
MNFSYFKAGSERWLFTMGSREFAELEKNRQLILYSQQYSIQ